MYENLNEKEKDGLEASAPPGGNFKTVFVVDLYDKRKRKNSVNTLFLNEIEKESLSLKEIENRLYTKKAIKEGFALANSVRIAKGYEPYKTVRDYLRNRLNKTVNYYVARDVIDGLFKGSYPLVVSVIDGIKKYRLNTLDV